MLGYIAKRIIHARKNLERGANAVVFADRQDVVIRDVRELSVDR